MTLHEISIMAALKCYIQKKGPNYIGPEFI